MMGRKQIFKCGSEYDLVTRFAKRYLKFKAGTRKQIKAILNRRERRETKVELKSKIEGN